MPTFFVPTIVRATAVSLATYDFIDNLVAKTLKRKILTNVATLTLDRDHKKEPGDIVYVNGISTHLEYNGYFVITAVPSTTSFSYALTHADEAETADLGGVIHDPIGSKSNGFYIRSGAGDIRYSLLGQSSIKVATKKILTNVATLTTQKDHGLQVGSTIILNGLTGALAADYNIAAAVTVINNSKSLSFALTHADDAENVDASGVVDDTILKTVGAQVYFVDMELVRKIHKTGTTATGIVIGYSR